jgi:hypothetical protein
MLVFNEEGFEEIPATMVKPYMIKASTAFIEKHGTKKIRDVSRKAMLYLRDSDPATHSFYQDKQDKGAIVDLSVNQKIHAVASSRGLTISALVRECLHNHLLSRVKPVKRKVERPSCVYAYMSPFEMKLLTQWCENADCFQTDYFSTLAAVLEPMEEPDLVSLYPRKEVPIYPTPVLYEKFAHNVRVYGYEGSVFIRQILAFLDRPFNPQSRHDRYLDWLTNGYASTLRAT